MNTKTDTLAIEKRVHVIKLCFTIIWLNILFFIARSFPVLSHEYFGGTVILTALCAILSFKIYNEREKNYAYGKEIFAPEFIFFLGLFISMTILGIFMLARTF